MRENKHLNTFLHLRSWASKNIQLQWFFDSLLGLHFCKQECVNFSTLNFLKPTCSIISTTRCVYVTLLPPHSSISPSPYTALLRLSSSGSRHMSPSIGRMCGSSAASTPPPLHRLAEVGDDLAQIRLGGWVGSQWGGIIWMSAHVIHIEHQKDYNSGWNVLHVNSCVIQMFHFKLFRWHSKQLLWKNCTDFDKKQFTARNVQGDWRHQLQKNWCTLQFEVLWIK